MLSRYFLFICVLSSLYQFLAITSLAAPAAVFKKGNDNSVILSKRCKSRLEQKYDNLTSLEVAKIEGIKLAFAFVEMKEAIVATIINSLTEDEEKLNAWLQSNNPSLSLQNIVANLNETEKNEVKTYNDQLDYSALLSFFDAKIAELPMSEQKTVMKYFIMLREFCEN